MNFSNKYYKLLRLLDTDPLMSFQDLADKLDVSWITAKRWYTDLQENDILYNPVANFDYRKLSMDRVNVLVQTPNYSALENMEEACKAHPYTNYRNRLIGRYYGLFIIFYIPATEVAHNNLEQFFHTLKGKNWITEFKSLTNIEEGINSYPDLNKYNWDNNEWEFDWLNWFENLREKQDVQWNGMHEKREVLDLEEIAFSHLKILNRISSNGSIKQSDLIRDEELQLSRTEAHRQYNFVMNELITDLENIYDRSKFSLDDLKLYRITFQSIEHRNRFLNQFESDKPPFRISIQIVDKNQIILWGQMDLISSQVLSFELFKMYSDIEVYDMVIYSNNSYRYRFYTKNFDLEEHRWRTSKEWMVDGPLEFLGLQ